MYALGKGVLKVMSKMGISTVGSYRGAQVFAVFGIDTDGARRVLHRHHHPHRRQRPGHHRRRRRRAGTRWPSCRTPRTLEHRGLEVGGQYQWRREGEIHLFNPETVYLLQHSTRSKQEKVFRRYTDAVDELSREGGTLRGLFELRTGERPAGAAGRGGAGRRRS